MTSLLRPSAKASLVPPDSNEPPSFHDSTFFKVLGRIDEETSFRASLSNITSQDSSPRSLNTSGDSNVTDWLTPLSPETFGNNNFSEKKISPADSQSSFGINDNDSNENGSHNISVITTITNVEDPKMEAAASAERRQDRSSPILLKSQNSSISPSNSESSLQSCLSGSTQDHHWRQEQLPTDDKDEEQVRRENLAVQRECQELELIVLRMKTEGNILQVRTQLKLKNYRAEIERATATKESIQTQCRELEDKIWSLRTETRLRQEAIWDAEKKLRSQKTNQHRGQQQQNLSNEAVVSASGEN